MTEETAIDGLKLCVDLIGKYPEDLNLMTLMQMVQELQDSKTARRPAAAEAPDQNDVSGEDR